MEVSDMYRRSMQYCDDTALSEKTLKNSESGTSWAAAAAAVARVST